MRKTILFFFFTLISSSLLGQGSLGVNFGLNDDNFGAIEILKTKLIIMTLILKIQLVFNLEFLLRSI